LSISAPFEHIHRTPLLLHYLVHLMLARRSVGCGFRHETQRNVKPHQARKCAHITDYIGPGRATHPIPIIAASKRSESAAMIKKTCMNAPARRTVGYDKADDDTYEQCQHQTFHRVGIGWVPRTVNRTLGIPRYTGVRSEATVTAEEDLSSAINGMKNGACGRLSRNSTHQLRTTCATTLRARPSTTTPPAWSHARQSNATEHAPQFLAQTSR
jgi:hypothetical protein